MLLDDDVEFALSLELDYVFFPLFFPVFLSSFSRHSFDV